MHGFNHRSDEIKASDADSRRKFKHQHSRPSFSHVRANKNQRTALSTNNYRAVKESLARKSRQRRAHDDKRWRNANSPLKTDKRSRVGGEYIHSSFAKLMERRTVDQCKAEGNKLNKYRNWAKDFVADNEDAVSHESLGDAWGRTTNYHTSKRREEKNKRKKGKKKIGSQKDVMINHTLAMLNAIADSASTTSQSIKAHTHPHTAQIETTINNSSTSTVGKIDGLQNSHSEKRLHAQNQSTSKSLSKSYSAVELRHPSSSSSVLSSSALAPIPKTSSTYVSSLSTAPLQSLAQTHSDHPSLAVPSMSPVDLTAFALFAPSTTSKSMEASLSVSRPVQTFKHEGRFYDQPSLDRKDGARGAKSATDSGSGAQHHRREASFGQAQLRGSHDVSEENEGNAEAGETGVGRLHLLSAKNHDLLHWDQNQNQHQQENQYSRKKTDGYCGDKNGVKTVPSSSLPPSVVDDAHSRERMGPSPSDSTDNKERPRLFSDITSHIEEYNAKQRVVMAEVDESIRAVVNHREKYCNDLTDNTLSVVKVASADRGSNLFRSYPSDNSRGNKSGTGNGNSGDVRERRSGRDSRGSHLRGSRNGSQFPTKEVFGRGAPGRKGDSLGLLDRMRHEKEADEERKNEQLLNQYHARHSRSVSRLRLNWPRNITLRALHQTGEGTAKGGESIAQSISLNTPHSLGDRAADANNGEIVDSTTKRRGGEGLPGVRAIMLGGKGNFYADPVTTEKQQQMMVMLEGRTSEARTRQETGSEQGDHETIDGRSNHRCNENGKDSANASLKTLAAKYNIACRLQTEVSLSSGDIKTYMDVSNMGRRFSAIEQERLSEQNKRTKTDVGSSQGSESSLRAVDTVHAEGQARDSSRAQPSSSDLSSLAQTKTKATPNSDVSTLITRPFEVPVLLDLPKSHVSVGSPIEGAMGNQVSYTVPAQEWDVNSEDHGAFIARLEKSSKVLRKQENFLILVRRRQNQLKEWVKQTQREDEAREKAEKKARREKSKRKTNNPEGSDGDDADSDEDDGADEDEDESFERKSVYTGSDRSMGGTEEDKEKTGVSKPDDGSRGKVKRAGRAKHTSKQRLMTYTEAHKIASVIEAANRNKIKIDITSMMGSVDKLMIRNIKRTLAEQDITNLETEILTHLLQYGHMPRKVIDNTPIPSVANRIVRLLKNARQVEYRASSEYWLMLVCDDESYRDELTSLLSEFGYRHVLEYSTQSYFHVLQQYPSRFDLVLLDNTVAGRDALFQIKNTPTLEHTKVAMIASAKNHRDSASLSGYTIADASGYGESDGVTSGVVGVDGMQPNGNVNRSKHITKTVLNMQQRLTAPPLPSSASEAKKKVSEKMAKIMEERKAPDVTKLIKNGADCIVWTWEFSTDYKELLTSKLNQAASSSCRNDLSGTASAVDTGEGNGKKAESSAGAGGPSSHAVVHGDEKGQDGKNDPLCRQTQNMPEAVKLYTSLVQDNPSLANMISCQNNTLEIRLMRVWRMCRFNNIHRMEMMGKYSQPAYVHLLSDALILWELLIQLVEFRFALLEKHHEEGLHTGAFLSFPPSGLELQANMHRRRKTPLFCLPASVTDSDLTLRERKKRLGVFLGALAVKREEAATAADRIRRAEEEISKIGTTSQAETMSTNLNSESGAIAVGVMGGLRRKSSVVMKRGRPSSVNAPALSDLALLTSAATERRKSTEKRKNKKNVKRMSTSTAAKRKGGGRAAGSITLPRMKRRGVSLFQTNIPEHGRADSRVESGSDSTNDSDSDTTSSEEEEEVKEIELVEDKNGYGDKYGDSYGPDYEEYMIIQSRSSVNAETDNQRTVDGTSISEQHASTGGTKKDGREVLTGVGGGSGDISDTKLKRRESAAGIDNTHTQDQGKNSRKSSLSDSSAVNTIRRRAGVPQDTRSQSFPLPSSSSPLTQSVTSPPFLYKPGLSLSSSAETSSTHLGINMESRVASVWYDHTERRDRVRARSLKYYDDLINRPLIEEESSTKSQNDGDRDSDNEDDGGWKKEWKKAKALSKSRSAPRLSALGVLARSNGKGATSPANKAMSPLMRALTGEKTTRRPSINILLKLKTTSSKVRMMDRRRSVIREQSIASSASPSLLTKSSGESLAKVCAFQRLRFINGDILQITNSGTPQSVLAFLYSTVYCSNLHSRTIHACAVRICFLTAIHMTLYTIETERSSAPWTYDSCANGAGSVAGQQGGSQEKTERGQGQESRKEGKDESTEEDGNVCGHEDHG